MSGYILAELDAYERVRGGRVERALAGELRLPDGSSLPVYAYVGNGWRRHGIALQQGPLPLRGWKRSKGA